MSPYGVISQRRHRRDQAASRALRITTSRDVAVVSPPTKADSGILSPKVASEIFYQEYTDLEGLEVGGIFWSLAHAIELKAEDAPLLFELAWGVLRDRKLEEILHPLAILLAQCDPKRGRSVLEKDLGGRTAV